MNDLAREVAELAKMDKHPDEVIVLRDVQEGKHIARELLGEMMDVIHGHIDCDLKMEEENEVLDGMYPWEIPVGLAHFMGYRVLEDRIVIVLDDDFAGTLYLRLKERMKELVSETRKKRLEEVSDE